MGDSTVYYGPNNNILHISVDGLPNAVVQLTEDDLQAFNNVFYWAKSNGKLHDDNANKVTRKFLGTTYLIDGFYDFWDKNSGHVLGGEGGPIVEHAAYLYKHGNTVSIGYNENYDQGNGTSVKWEEPFDIPFYQGDFNRVAKIHTHDAYGPTSGDPEPSIPDRRNHTDNQKGIFNIVVTKKEVYFYNSKSGINNFRVPRDIFEKREFYLKNPPVYNSKYNEK